MQGKKDNLNKKWFFQTAERDFYWWEGDLTLLAPVGNPFTVNLIKYLGEHMIADFNTEIDKLVKFCEKNGIKAGRFSRIEKEDDLLFEGDSFEDFLNLTKALKVGLIYWNVFEDTFERGDEEGKICKSQEGVLCVYFYYNDIVHNYKKTTEFFNDMILEYENEGEENEDAMENEDESPNEILRRELKEKESEKFVGELIDYTEKNYPKANEDGRVVNTSIETYWQTRGVANYYSYVRQFSGDEASLKLKWDNILEEVRKYFKNAKESKNKPKYGTL